MTNLRWYAVATDGIPSHKYLTIMYTDEDNSTDLIGAFCELLFPRKGHRNGIIVDDYGNEWLVLLTNGREVPVYKDEVFII